MKFLLQKFRMWRWRRTMCGDRLTGTGMRFRLRGYDDWLIWHEIFELGEYDESLYKLCELARKESALIKVLDLGANVGFFALRLFDRWRAEGLPISRLQVLSIEPDDMNCAAIKELQLLNGVPPTQWQMIQGLVGESSGHGILTAGPGHFAHAVTKEKTEEGKSVPYIDLLSLRDGSLSSHYLKVDIEGSEDTLFTSYPTLLRQSEVVCIETHSADTRNRVLSAIRDAGFPPPVEQSLKSEFGSLLTTMWTSR